MIPDHVSLLVFLVRLMQGHFYDAFCVTACIPLSFVYPALFHYKAIANTRKQKVIDIMLGVTGLIVMVYVTYITLYSWIGGEGDKPGAPRCPMPEDDIIMP